MPTVTEAERCNCCRWWQQTGQLDSGLHVADGQPWLYGIGACSEERSCYAGSNVPSWNRCEYWRRARRKAAEAQGESEQ